MRFAVCKMHTPSTKGISSIWISGIRRYVHVTPTFQKKIPSNLKGKSQSSQAWITRQLNDPYVKKAQEMNYRARSAFKLIEIDDKAKILKPGQTIIECGAAPGAWTQVIVDRINADGKDPKRRVGTVVGIDLLPIAPMKGAIFLDGCDFTSNDTVRKVKEILAARKTKYAEQTGIKSEDKTQDDSTTHNGSVKANNIAEGRKTCKAHLYSQLLVDIVLSDMAPNATGHQETDHMRIIKLVEAALQFSLENVRPRGHFLAKFWAGNELKRVENLIASHYDKVVRFKPPSSRSDSSEIFVLGKYKK